MQFKLEITRTSGAAFRDFDGEEMDQTRNSEIARILRVAAHRLDNDDLRQNLLDLNGSTVGTMWFEEDDK